MENSWQMKCSPPLPLSAPMLPSSTAAATQNPPQEPRNQMKMSLGHCALPQNAQEPILTSPGVQSGPTFSYMPNFGSCKPITAESGHSFLPVASVPPLFRYDFQQHSIGKSSGGSYYPDKSSFCNTGTMPNCPLLQNREKINPGRRTPASDVQPAYPFSPTLSTRNYNIHAPRNDLDAPRAVISHSGLKTENGSSILQKRLSFPPSRTVDGEVCHGSKGRSTLEASRHAPSSVPMNQTSLGSECPRVFCMSACGDLLLSNTGLLGILCSCHGLHMSVSNFCEHSGLSDVNPGYAVRMDSGECIAQWRKLYLQKFGIMASDDHRGWDWPEGFLTTSSLVRSNVAVPDGRKAFDLSGLFTSSAELFKCSQPRNNVFPSNHQLSQECANKILKTEQPGHSYLPYPLMGHTMSSGRNSYIKIDNPLTTCRTPSNLMVSRTTVEGGSRNDCQSSSFRPGIISSSENLFSLADRNMQGIGSKTNNSLKDEIVLQSSGLPTSDEWKLGQASQWGWGVGSTTQSTTKSNIWDLQTSTFQGQLADISGNSRVVEYSDQHPHFHPISNLRQAKEQVQLDRLNSDPCTVNGASNLKHWKDGLCTTSDISVPFSSSRISAGGSCVHHKENNKGTKESHQFMPWKIHHQAHIERSRLMGLSCDGGDGPIWPSGIKELISRNKKNCTTTARCGHHSNSRSDSSFRICAQTMENSGFFTNSGKPSCPNNHREPDERCNSLGMAGMLPDIYCASNHVENTCRLASIVDQSHVSSSLVFGATKTLEASFFGSTSLTAVCGAGHNSASLNKDVHAVNSCRPDESSRFLALRSANQLLKERQADASKGLNQRLRNHPQQREWIKDCGTSNVGEHGSFLELWPSEGRPEHPFTFGDGATPIVVLDTGGKQACDVRNAIAAKGNSNLDGLPIFMHGMAFNSEVTDNDKFVQGQCALQPKEQSSLRGEKKVSGCSMFQRCCKGSCTCVSGRCCCSVPSTHSNKESYSKETCFVNGLNKQESKEVVEAPKLDVFKLSDSSAHTGKAILPEGSRKMKEQIHGKLDCLFSQWKDVPPKFYSVSKLRNSSASEKLLVRNGEAESDLKGIGAEAISSNQVAELEGNESSNISSGSSEPAVTQASIEVYKVDSSTVVAVDTGKHDDQIVDQGSVIDISCCSDVIDSVKSSQHVHCGKASSAEEESPAELLCIAPCVADEFEQRYLESKELQILGNSRVTCGKFSHATQKNENGFKPRKRKHITKSNILGTSVAVSHVSLLPSESQVHTRNAPDHHAFSTEDVQARALSNQASCKVFDSNIKGCSFKRRRSASSSIKMLSRKRDLNGIYNFSECESDDQRPIRDNSNSVAIPEDIAVKRLRHAKPAEPVMKPVKAIKAAKQVCLYSSDSDGTLKYSVRQKPVLTSDENLCNWKAKPVACGKYGIICNQELDLDQLKPPKILSLNQVLRSSQKISEFENEDAQSLVGNMVYCSDGHKGRCGSLTSRNGQVSQAVLWEGGFLEASARDACRTYHGEDEPSAEDWPGLGKVKISGSKRSASFSSCCPAQSKPKEIRVRSLYELSMKGKEVLSAEFSLCRTVMCEISTECNSVRDLCKDSGEYDGEKCNSLARRLLEKTTCGSFISELEALCCICGIPNEDNSNCLLECGRCFIQIHQACYGISRVLKGDWYCRPCKTDAKNVACVLCGYGGGAMTRAFGSRGVVKSLLKAWNIREEPHIMCLGSAETLHVSAKMDSETAKFRSFSSIKPMHNSIIAGLFDRTVRQWVHVVCGLWTPGTRRPNVGTMSAFDVSGVSRPKAHMVCHICKRPGGSCTRCHVETCSSYFHPWCAHQKSLLQREVEYNDNHEVHFYGRCLLHADHQPYAPDSDDDSDKNDPETSKEKEPTCARIEVYRASKLEGGKRSSGRHNGKGKCLVTQVQLDAWLYINKGLKRLPNPPVSDAEPDYRKEYARYKHAKGWKQLVVYKSGIHALGLYTSQFIASGGMVVEYVGEIVGPRVADKRESEYLSGRKLQYKGACYFFRIDKEQIIDATRKGGIARFVNHSCQPNCVAKVITVRSEKKVVFFAQRDIYPGEEITYDYHFNNEDEGKKIPCFCRSNNCRRYLN